MPHRSPLLTLRVFLFVIASIVAIGSAVPAFAQDVPPVYPAIDANGVNVSTGRFVYSHTDVVIGQPGQGGLAYTRYYETGTSGIPAIQTDNQIGYIVGGTQFCSVVLGFHTESFTSTADVCQGTNTSDQANGSTLTYNASTQVYTFTESDGTVATFDTPAPCGAGCNVVIRGMNEPAAYLSSITKPDGEVIDYSYEFGSPTCYPQPDTLPCNSPLFVYGHLVRVDNSLGYRLNLLYDSLPKYMVPPVTVVGVNAAVENCLGSSCSNPWPTATYAYDTNGNVTSETDGLGAQTIYNFSGPQLTGIQFPDDPTNHQINLTYKPSTSGTFYGFVDKVNEGFGTWTYNYADDGSGGRTTTVTNPDSTTRSYQLTIATGRINVVTNERNKQLKYAYDAYNRREKVTEPEGNYTQYTYDSRGNITKVRRVSKTPGTPADIVTSAQYPATCSNPVTCNKPTSTTDAALNETDYYYDPTHGGITKVVAPTTTLGRLTTTYNYTQYQAYYMDTSGNWIHGTPVWRLTSTSKCATASTCAGTANETVTTIAYASTPNNVLPSSITKAAGDNSVSATTSLTYTNWGDVSTVQGPLGAADTTRYYYDNDRRLTGIAGPDPVSSGAYRAVKKSYNAIGEPTVVERGTVPSQGDSAFSSFTALEKQETAYDEYGRRQYSRLWDTATSTIVALTQYNYDNMGRPLCTAVRMTPASFASPPSDACALYNHGSGGEDDRITHTLYFPDGSVKEEDSAYGTSAEQTVVYSYTDNGKVDTRTDAGNLTKYVYDGLDRLKDRYYPDKNTAGQYSSTDYEEYTYYSSGELHTEQLRDGVPVTFAYYLPGQVATRQAGSEAPVTYTYDLFGRLTSASQNGETITDNYDALSRLRSEESVISGQSVDDTVSYTYDAAGDRKEMDYPGGFYVTYAYDNAGDLTDIYENGATRLAHYTYDTLGRRQTLQRLPDAATPGAVTSYGYDAVSRLASLTQNAKGTSYDTSISFGYNPASQIVSRTDTNPIYDLPEATASSQSYTPNGLNQYATALGTTPTYNARGDLTGDGTNTYHYDEENRLTTSASAGVTLDYDPAGRLREVSGSSTTRYVYDGDQVIATYDTSGNVLQRYVYGPGTDDPLVRYEGSGVTNRSWLLADERGSVIGITDDSGNVTQVNKYNAYGIPDASNQGRFQYTGQMWIPELSLYYYKAREYHPKLGRFMQPDPIGYAGGMNLYAYGGNDPVNMLDPTGTNDTSWLCNTYADGGDGGVCYQPPPRPLEHVNVYGTQPNYNLDINFWLHQGNPGVAPYYGENGGGAGGNGQRVPISQIRQYLGKERPNVPSRACALAKTTGRETSGVNKIETGLSGIDAGGRALAGVAVHAPSDLKYAAYAIGETVAKHAGPVVLVVGGVDVVSSFAQGGVSDGLYHTADFAVDAALSLGGPVGVGVAIVYDSVGGTRAVVHAAAVAACMSHL